MPFCLQHGSGTRFGGDKNKVYIEILDKPIISYSLNVFDKNKSIDEIILVVKDGEEEMINQILRQEKQEKPIKIVKGGKTRKESVYNALKEADCDIVLVHDSARPAIKSEYIDRCLQEMDRYKGVSIGVKSKDTIKITDENGVIVSTTKRANTWIVQTPQCFAKTELLMAHNKFINDETATDDCVLLENMRI